MTATFIEEDLQKSFRTIMGKYATGVALITASDGNRRYGMAVNSFTSVSLSPTLLLFCPARTSSTWAQIAGIGHFCVSILAENQEHVSRQFASKNIERFAGLDWSESPMGHPALGESLGWIDCSIEDSYPAGDHYIVTARAESWSTSNELTEPLVFFSGQYRNSRPILGSGTR